ncbi:MAG: VOC family protein [Candidatus Omnitrophica bacterium]|nr:VOC family protein [Candidatus Omnitrophota bacterium]
MIKNFRHSCIVVQDLDKSLKFYTGLIGLKVAKVLTVKGRYPQTVLGIKGIRLTYVKLRTPNQAKNNTPIFELHYWKNPRIKQRQAYSHISFTVQDIGYEYKRLSKGGVKFISEPVRSPDGKTKICFAYDPDSNLIEFVEDLKK